MNEHRLKKYVDSFYLCGFMATGKSSIGSILSKKLELPFQDLDRYLERKEGRSISDIFKDEGEPYFREKEREFLMDLSTSFKGILALGGGSLQNQNIVDHLKLHGLLIFIETPIDVIVKRVLRNKKRPIVLDKQGKIKSREVLLNELNMLYSNREKFYKQAQIQVKSDGFGTEEQLVDIIIDKIKKHV